MTEQTQQTKEYKHMYWGNTKETSVEIFDHNKGITRLLELTTMKRSGGNIVTISQGYILAEDRNSKSCMLFEDFSKEYARVSKNATKKAISELHDSVNIAEVIKDFKEFYKIEDLT